MVAGRKQKAMIDDSTTAYLSVGITFSASELRMLEAKGYSLEKEGPEALRRYVIDILSKSFESLVLTHRQKIDTPELDDDELGILNFIIDFKNSHDGNSPTLVEMVEAGFASSPTAIVHVLDSLIEAGYITREPFHARSIEVIQ